MKMPLYHVFYTHTHKVTQEVTYTFSPTFCHLTKNLWSGNVLP